MRQGWAGLNLRAPFRALFGSTATCESPVCSLGKIVEKFSRDPTRFPRARERPWPGFSLAKIVETISARPYAFRRGPGNGPGQVFHGRKSSRRFPRDPTHFAAGQGTALARFFMGTS